MHLISSWEHGGSLNRIMGPCIKILSLKMGISDEQFYVMFLGEQVLGMLQLHWAVAELR
jgi:hypothetical protein